MKKFFLGLGIAALILTGNVFAAFPTDGVDILDKKQVEQLTDDVLIERYIDMLVEMDALKTFHNTSGFTPKDYQNYKAMLKYRLLLLFEIHKRKLEIPQTFE